MPDYSLAQWSLLILAGFSCGMGKSGLAGVGMMTVVLMAQIIPGKASSGAVLPLLIFADILAAALFRQQILWHHIDAGIYDEMRQGCGQPAHRSIRSVIKTAPHRQRSRCTACVRVDVILRQTGARYRSVHFDIRQGRAHNLAHLAWRHLTR
jgi:hypothetical protein